MCPYISGPRREAYAILRQAIKQTRIDNIGEFTYLLDLLADTYMATHNSDYQHMCQVVGAFDCAKSEFMRQVLNPHEDERRISNGDIWGTT